MLPRDQNKSTTEKEPQAAFQWVLSQHSKTQSAASHLKLRKGIQYLCLNPQLCDYWPGSKDKKANSKRRAVEEAEDLIEKKKIQQKTEKQAH